jgi:hypothetical protein
MEVVISLAVFGVFMLLITQLTLEMNGYDKRYPVNYMSHPQVASLVARLRRDVYDATSPYYLSDYGTYSNSPKTLILYSLQPSGFAETVVWDFSKKGEAWRRAYSVGNLTTEWVARGVPQITLLDFPIEGHPDSVRVQAKDTEGQIAIDQVFQPRSHE